MPRKGPAARREILPDPKYHDISVSKFANMMMLDGEKGKVEKIIYGAMDLIQQRTGEDALEVFKRALETQNRLLRSGHAELGVRPTRCRLKYAKSGGILWRCAGLSNLPDNARKRVWKRSWPVNSLRRLRIEGAP